MKIARSRGIEKKGYDATNNSHDGGNSWDISVRAENGFNVLDNTHTFANEFSSGVPLLNVHKYATEDEDARGVIDLNTDEEVKLPSTEEAVVRHLLKILC